MDYFYTFIALVVAFMIITIIRQKITLAHFFVYFAKLYNERMGARKKLLFDGLNQLKKKRDDGKLHILDVGCGNGANFQFFPAGSEVICIDPNRYFEAILRNNVSQFPDIRASEFHFGRVEDMTDLVKTESVDAVVCTIVLCSVKDVVRGLQEILRVLKPVS